MDNGDPGAQDSADRPERDSAPEELSGLKERIARLEAHVAGLEGALKRMGWTQLTDYSAPGRSTAAPASQLPPSAPSVVPPPATPLPPAFPPAISPPPASGPAPAQRRGRRTARPFPAYQSGASSDAAPVASPFGPVELWVAHVQEAPAEAPEPKPQEPAFDWVGFVARLGPAKLLALVGGIALLLGMAYFLSLANSRGWITDEMRVLLGLVIGFGMLPVGALLFDRERPTLGHVVVAVGLAVIDLALFASSQFGLAPARIALIGAVIAAAGAGVIAVRWNSQLVAGMGIAAVLAAPPIVSAPADLVTVFFLGAVLVGVAYVSFRRDWEWLAWLSFALTAPQLLVWLAPGGVEPALVMVVLGLYWILFAVSALLPVVLGTGRDLARQISLLAAITAFVTASAWLGLADPLWRGAFIAALAAGNLAAGLGLVRRRGLNDDLAQSALGLGIALYVVAIALLLGGPAIPIAWTLALALSGWVWARFGLLRAQMVALALGVLVAIHLLVVEFPVTVWLGGSVALRPEQLLPYADAEGVALAVYLIGLAVVARLVRDRLVSQAIAAFAALLIAATLPVEAVTVSSRWAAPPLLSAGWTGLAALALLADRHWHARWRFDSLRRPLPVAGGLLGVAALGYLALLYLAIYWYTGFGPRPGQLVPYTDNEGIALAIYLLGLAAVFVLSRTALPRQWIAAGAALLVAATLPIETGDQTALVKAPLLALGWTALAFAALAADGRWHAQWRFDPVHQPLPIAGALLGILALGSLGLSYSLFDLGAPFQPGRVPFTDESSLITLVIVASIVLLAVSRRDATERFSVACLSLIVIAVLLRQQLPLEWAVGGWCLIAAGVLVATPRDELRSRVGYLVAGLLLGCGAFATVAVIAPPTRLLVQPISAGLGMGPPNAVTIATVAMALGLAVATWREGRMLGTRWLGIGVMVALIYGLSIALVDSFAVRVPSPEALEEIGKQAQVSLTMLWALIGLGLLGYGLLRDSLAGRGAGLALLSLATAKAFLYDLAALDIAYRVLSFVGLGVLLLAGAFAYQRLRSRSGSGGAAAAAS